MGLTKFDRTSGKQWQSVSRPVAKSENALPDNFHGPPPPVLPKPEGLVYVYVPSETTTDSYQLRSQIESGAFPHGSRIIYSGIQRKPASFSNGPLVQYPCTDECLELDAKTRLKNRAKKSGKGYKVLADVNSGSSRNASKGGRMFMKQKKKVKEHVSEGKAIEDFPTFSSTSRNYSNKGKSYSRDATKSLSTVLSNSTAEQRKKMGHVYPRLRSPPPEWKAKVDSDYSVYEQANSHLDIADVAGRPFLRSKSVPPPENMHYPSSDAHHDQYSSGSGRDIRPSSGSGITMINFDAKLHKDSYHLKQDHNYERGMLSKPHVQYDFNARPVGWSKNYAKQY